MSVGIKGYPTGWRVNRDTLARHGYPGGTQVPPAGPSPGPHPEPVRRGPSARRYPSSYGKTQVGRHPSRLPRVGGVASVAKYALPKRVRRYISLIEWGLRIFDVIGGEVPVRKGGVDPTGWVSSYGCSTFGPVFYSGSPWALACNSDATLVKASYPSGPPQGVTDISLFGDGSYWRTFPAQQFIDHPGAPDTYWLVPKTQGPWTKHTPVGTTDPLVETAPLYGLPDPIWPFVQPIDPMMVPPGAPAFVPVPLPFPVVRALPDEHPTGEGRTAGPPPRGGRATGFDPVPEPDAVPEPQPVRVRTTPGGTRLVEDPRPVVPPEIYVPPAPYEREVPKSYTSYALARRIFSGLTEAVDVIAPAYWALPRKCQVANRKGQPVDPYTMAEKIWECLSHMSLKEMRDSLYVERTLVGIALAQGIDVLSAIPGRAAKKLARDWGMSVGATFGQGALRGLRKTAEIPTGEMPAGFLTVAKYGEAGYEKIVVTVRRPPRRETVRRPGA